jgi:hypothetical protein
MQPASRRIQHAGAVKASDEDRERTVARLRSHYAAGRFAADELEERVERTCRAATRGELWGLVWDLPRVPSRRGAWSRVAHVNRAALRLHAGAYASVNGTLVGIWLLTGEGSFWPAWVLLPGTVMLGWHVAATRHLRRRLEDARARSLDSAGPDSSGILGAG